MYSLWGNGSAVLKSFICTTSKACFIFLDFGIKIFYVNSVSIVFYPGRYLTTEGSEGKFNKKTL